METLILKNKNKGWAMDVSLDIVGVLPWIFFRWA
jgi:hypothetical protein